MAGQLELSGTITIAGDDCSCVGAGDSLVKAIGSECPTGYQTCVATAKPISVATTGVLGAEFVDLDLLDSLTRIEFLYVRSNAEIILRIGAAPAQLDGSGGTFPTTFAGGETLNLTIDTVSFIVTFDVADQTAAQCAARINAAAALAGLATPRASVLASGELSINGVLTGSAGGVAVTGGTGAATLGLAVSSVVGSGADVNVLGTFLNEFPRNTNAPSRVQVSGVASVSVVAGGRSDGN
jgi:hypothetical protein